MKKFKTLLVVVLGVIIAYTTNVLAAGTVTVGMGGNSSVTLNNEIEIPISLSSISGTTEGIVAFQGDVHFDTTYLTLVSVTEATSPYSFDYEVSGNTVYLTGLDTSFRKGVKSTTTIYTFKFKAIKAGTTTVSLENVIAGDPAGDATANNANKQITIVAGSVEPEPTPTQSSDATLKVLSVDGYSISPAFDKDTTSYTLTVPNDATSVEIKATANDTKVKSISGIGTKTLSEGGNTVAIVVTAEDGTTKTYTLTITRETSTQPEDTRSSDATLKSLSISGQTISPAFDKDTTSYTLTVPNGTKSIDVSAIANDSKATVTISDNAKNLKEGVNPVKVTVKAENGTTKVYTINVTRKASATPATTTTKSSNNYLKTLSTVNGDIKPEFKKTTNNYNITVPYSVSKLTDLQAVPEDAKASVKIEGNANFKVDEVNTVEIIVTAEDGSERIYTVNVTRSSKSGDVLLEDINVSGGGITGLNPKFNPDQFEYTVDVPQGTNSINVIPKSANPKAKVEVTGTDNLQDGNNVVLIKVTDQDGFVQYYKINAYKKATNGLLLFGVDFPKWMIYTLITLIPILLILFALARRKKEEQQPATAGSTIEFKPEFNFSSKNGTDDDYVESGGVLNQSSGIPQEHTQAIDIRNIPTGQEYDGGVTTGLNKSMMEQYPKKVIEPEVNELPYDPYDENVTKDELIDAINEKNPEKLKILYQQEMLNREKERIKEEEYQQTRSRYHDDER